MLSSCANTVGKSWVFGLCVFFLVLVKFDLSFSQSYTYTPLAAACDGVWTNGSCWSKNDDGYLTPSSSSFPPIGLNRPTSSFTSSNQIKVIFNDSFTMPSSFYFDANTVEIVIDEGAEFSIQGSWYLVKESNYLITANSPSGNSAFMNVWGGVFYQSKATLSLNDGSATSLPPYPTTLTFTTTRVAIPDTDKYNSFSLSVNKESLLRVSDLLSFPNAEKNKLIIDGGRAELGTVYISAGTSQVLDTNQISVENLGQLAICSDLNMEGQSYVFLDDSFYFDEFDNLYTAELYVSSIDITGDAILEVNGFLKFEFLFISSQAKINFGFESEFKFYADNVTYSGSEYLLNGYSNMVLSDFLNQQIYWDDAVTFEDDYGFLELGEWCVNILPVYISRFGGEFRSVTKDILLTSNISLSEETKIVVLRAEDTRLEWNKIYELKSEGNYLLDTDFQFVDKNFNLFSSYYYYKIVLLDSKDSIFSESKIISIKLPDIDDPIIALYPNPTFDYFQISSLYKSSVFDIKIFSMSGILVKAFSKASLFDINQELKVYSSLIPSGGYLVQIIQDNHYVFDKKIIKL